MRGYLKWKGELLVTEKCILCEEDEKTYGSEEDIGFPCLSIFLLHGFLIQDCKYLEDTDDQIQEKKSVLIIFALI